MPMFNVAEYVVRAINSVKAQTFSHWELIVVDDCSDDAGANIVAALAESDPRIRLFRRDLNGGAGAARNTALEQARGDWIALIDADDVWRPHRLARLMQVARETRADFVADNHIFFDDALGHETGVATHFPHELNHLKLTDLLRSESDGGFPLSLLQPLVSLAFLRGARLKYASEIRFAEDMHLYARLLINGAKAVVLNEAMYVYTNPIGQVSRKRSKATRTVNNASTKVWIADDLMQHYQSRLSDNEKTEVGKYKARAVQKHHAQSLTELRANKQWLSALSVAVRSPRLTWRYMAKSSLKRKLVLGAHGALTGAAARHTQLDRFLVEAGNSLNASTPQLRKL